MIEDRIASRNLARRASVRFGLVGLAAGVVGTLVLTASPDTILSRGYGNALGHVETTWNSGRSPNIWLSKATEQPQSLPKSIAVGDEIAISGKGEQATKIQVTHLEQVDGESMGLGPVQFQIVTGRLVDGSAAPRTVRLLFSVDPARAGPPQGRSADKVL
jgi:hypothetical protein